MKDNEEEKQKSEYGLKDPPPREYTTARGRLFEFGKPALRHRKVVSKVMKFMAAPKADYDGMLKCAKKRKITIDEFIKLDETQLTEDELRMVMKDSDPGQQAELTEYMLDILVDVLFSTIKKAPFQFSTIDELEAEMDDLGESIELFPIAVKWVAMAIADIGKLNRKN